MTGWQRRSVGVLLIGVLAGAPAVGILCEMRCADGHLSRSVEHSADGTHHHHPVKSAEPYASTSTRASHHYHTGIAIEGDAVSTAGWVSASGCVQLFAGPPIEPTKRTEFNSPAGTAESRHAVAFGAGALAPAAAPVYKSPPGEEPALRSVVLRV